MHEIDSGMRCNHFGQDRMSVDLFDCSNHRIVAGETVGFARRRATNVLM